MVIQKLDEWVITYMEVSGTNKALIKPFWWVGKKKKTSIKTTGLVYVYIYVYLISAYKNEWKSI